VKCIFSVDVEDWFHILDVPSAPPLEAWDAQPSHVEACFRKLLLLFEERRAKTTCFFLGYVAQRFPALVREAAAAGHEIASHGYAHRLVYEQTENEFYEDATKAKSILEATAGVPVLGYRSAGFSITERTPWYFDCLAKAGYIYDSSVFPAPRGHGGMKTSAYAPHDVPVASGRLHEFPITVAEIAGRPICFFGGGYLRLFPYRVVRHMARRVLAEGRPVVFYVHPREVRPDHPRLPMPLGRRFRSYVNLHTTERKVRSILRDFEVTTFKDWMATEYRGQM
jgi:polysaccharide deacetylase family protein (PEP-CTERM system associated)